LKEITQRPPEREKEKEAPLGKPGEFSRKRIPDKPKKEKTKPPKKKNKGKRIFRGPSRKRGG